PAAEAMLPVFATIALTPAYTGRPPSFASENCGVRAALTSTTPTWSSPDDTTPCTPSTNRLSRTGPDQSAAARSDRGCLNPALNSDTFGVLAAYTVPAEPVAQLVGIDAASVRNESQFGDGAARPTQEIDRVDAGNPVALIAGAMSSADAMFWNTPTPAWITACGGRAEPGA